MPARLRRADAKSPQIMVHFERVMSDVITFLKIDTDRNRYFRPTMNPVREQARIKDTQPGGQIESHGLCLLSIRAELKERDPVRTSVMPQYVRCVEDEFKIDLRIGLPWRLRAPNAWMMG